MSVSVKVTSYRPQVEKKLEDLMRKNMEKVGAVVERQAKINVSKSPPEHPQVQTGRGRASIIHQTTKQGTELVEEFGTNVFYMKIQELGSINQPPYPWLLPAVDMNKPQIEKILGNKVAYESNI